MEAQKRLYELQKLTRIIGHKLMEFEHWRSKAEQTTSSSSEGHGSGISDKVGNNVVKYVELEEDVKEYNDRRNKIIKEIEQLPLEEYDILYFLYADPSDEGHNNLYTYSEIKGHTPSWAFKVKKQAVEHYEEWIENSTTGNKIPLQETK